MEKDKETPEEIENKEEQPEKDFFDEIIDCMNNDDIHTFKSKVGDEIQRDIDQQAQEYIKSGEAWKSFANGRLKEGKEEESVMLYKKYNGDMKLIKKDLEKKYPKDLKKIANIMKMVELIK